jgi:flavin reductase (DIM6/NTAB) family NADH-FMN oxidoreductase RutF
MLKTFSQQDILGFEQRYRTTFVNSLAGYKLPVLIGTINTSGVTNLAIFSSYFHLGAHPPLFGLVVRPDSVERHTLNNIRQTKSFTVNFVDDTFFKMAHQTSARYENGISEFKEVNLNEEYFDSRNIPYVEESAIKIEALNLRELEVKENGTIILINEIKQVTLKENCISKDGYIDLSSQNIVASQGLDAYFKTELITRLSYAKPNKMPDEI